MAKKVLSSAAPKADGNGQAQQDGSASRGALVADIIIANAPDPVFVSDLEGKILQANDAVSELLGFRKDEVVEQSLSRFISPEETQEFTAALREVVERGVSVRSLFGRPDDQKLISSLTLFAGVAADLVRIADADADQVERRVPDDLGNYHPADESGAPQHDSLAHLRSTASGRRARSTADTALPGSAAAP